jgi:hypothetical protein
MENKDLIELLVNIMNIDEIQIQDEQGNTALHLALMQYVPSYDIVSILLKKYNDRYFMLKNIYEKTVLQLDFIDPKKRIQTLFINKCGELVKTIDKKQNNLTSYINYFQKEIDKEKMRVKLLKTKQPKIKFKQKDNKKYSGDLKDDFKVEDVLIDELYEKDDDYEENTMEDEFLIVGPKKKIIERYITEKYDIFGKIAIHVYNGYFEKMLGVHGLWPETNNKYLDTNYILGDEFKICKNFSKENGEMNEILMQHEWDAHGVYSGYMKYRDYFNKSCELSVPIIDMIKKIPAWNDKSIKDNKTRWTGVKEYIIQKYKNNVVIKEPVNDKILTNRELYFPIIKKANETEWKLDINI